MLHMAMAFHGSTGCGLTSGPAASFAFSIPHRLVPRERTGIGESKEATDPFHDVQWIFADMLSLS